MHGDSSSAGRAQVDEPDPAELPTEAANLQIVLLPDGPELKHPWMLTMVRLLVAHLPRAS